MTIYLIRHTQTVMGKGVCYGQADVEVDYKMFHPTAEYIKATLPANSIDEVISSPAKRCKVLAKEIANGNDYKIEKKIHELNFGEWELKNWEEINGEEFNKWCDDYITNAPPKGENYQSMLKRVKSFWDNIQKNRNRGKKIAIVTHAGVIRALLSLLLDIPLDKSFYIKIGFGKIVQVNIIDIKYNEIIFI